MPHRLGYVYKKPKLVPGKVKSEAQKCFAEGFGNLEQAKATEAPMCFMDAIHPLRDPVLGHGRISRVLVPAIQSSTEHDRLDISVSIGQSHAPDAM